MRFTQEKFLSSRKTWRDKQEYQCNQSHANIHTNLGSIINNYPTGNSDGDRSIHIEFPERS